MNTESMDIYSDILQTLGLDPSQGGARFLKLLSIWVAVVVLTTFLVFKCSTSNLSSGLGRISCCAAVPPIPNTTLKTLKHCDTGFEDFRLMIMGLSADNSRGIHDPSTRKKQPVRIYDKGHITFIPTTIRGIGDVSGISRGLFRIRAWRDRLHTAMEEALL